MKYCSSLRDHNHRRVRFNPESRVGQPTGLTPTGLIEIIYTPKTCAACFWMKRELGELED